MILLLLWIVVGVVTGIIVNAIDPYATDEKTVGAIVLGITGAFLFGTIASLLFGLSLSPTSVTTLFIAAGGAFLLLLFTRGIFHL